MASNTLSKFLETQREKACKACMVIAFDLDGTLCHGEYWGKGEQPKPNATMIGILNELSMSNFIVIHTARREEPQTIADTLKWLKQNGVRYHSIHFGKMPADIYIDDKSYNPFIEH